MKQSKSDTSIIAVPSIDTDTQDSVEASSSVIDDPEDASFDGDTGSVKSFL